MCYYQYLPMYKGILEDGINAVVPWEQPREFYENLGTSDREILDSYGYETFNDFIPKVDYDVAPWYPIYSFSDNLSVDTPAGIAKQKMTEIKRNWDKYIYELRSNVNINEYEKALTNEVKRRVKEYSD